MLNEHGAVSRHVPVQHIPARLVDADDRLCEAAQRFGTPLYAYDNATLVASWKTLRAALPVEVDLHFSVKANPNLALLQLFAHLGASFEVASLGELEACRRAGIALNRVLFAGPGKSETELGVAAEMGLRAVVVESLSELKRYSDIAQAKDVDVRVALRVNAGKGHGALLMGGSTQFGMPEEDAASAIRARAELARVEIIGIHVFLGTRILDSGTLCAQFHTGLSVAARLQADTGVAFRFVDIGGGFGVAYYDRDSPLDLSAVGQCLAGLVGDYRRDHPWTEVIAVESGRYLVAPCGVFLATVLDVKGTSDHQFAVLDGGTNVFGGQDLYGGARATPVRVLRSRSGAGIPLTICGPLCTPMDRLGADLVMPPVDVGDVIAFYHAGAYGYSAAPGLFLSHGYPGEVLMFDHGMVEIRRRQAIDSLFQDQTIGALTELPE